MKKANLSHREIVLIWTVVLMLSVTCCVYFLIMPSVREYRDAGILLRDAEIKMASAQVELSSLPQILGEIDENIRWLNENMLKYDIFTHNEDIDYAITYYLLRNYSTPTDLYIGYIAKDNEADIDGYLSARTSTIGGLIKFNVRVLATGSFSDMLKLLDYINSSYSYRLIGMNLHGGGSERESCSYTMEVVLRY